MREQILHMKIAIVHYWLVSWRGGEQVLEQLLNLYPEADLYTHVYDPNLTNEKFPGRRILTSFIHKLPNAKNWYQKYLPLMPFALEQLDFSDYDLVISSESGPAKNIIINPDATHICYCHSPMRYVWDMYHIYQEDAGLITRLLMKPIVHYLKVIDRISADRVDHFIANSTFISKRIEKCYRRQSKVIHPPVDIEAFELQEEKQDFYLYLGQLTNYKKADLLVDTFKMNGKKLTIIGEGELENKLRSSASSNITIMGKQDFNIVKQQLMNAKALIFPGIEDFGIVPVEALACGTPVIAYRKGGALETIIEGESGIFFDKQNIESLSTAINKFENLDFSPQLMRRQAEKFSLDIFNHKIQHFINNTLK